MHKKWYASVSVTALTVGLVGASASAALADPETDGSGGVASGNQINVPADVEAELCGNSLAALGISEAECTEVAEVLYAAGDGGGGETDGSGGVASGNQVNVPVDAAVDICGNSAAVGGISEADCTKIAEKLAEESGDGGGETDGSGGVASGNQINLPVNIAVDVCGNSLAALGISEAECTEVVEEIEKSEDNGGGGETDGSGGVASGNQVNVPVDAAVDICGNSAAVVGISEASCMTKISSEDSEDPEAPEDPKDPEEPGGENPDEPDNGGDESDEEENNGDKGDGSSDSTNDKEAAAGDDDTDTAGALPVTGASLAGMVAAALAALGVGGAALYFSRKRKAALATEENSVA
ncbi:chaplin [Halostreptopolyspora alba]|uniref:DUF320 domain-containing protein n=1 Tax=Halostreptopolyspora alba TaxID=2487137 RepID=A0A3N0E558_9ACTN|nr:DUF320 domain-containing protein [Nocardiopsaceae bacterium YIM 96095]